MTLNGHGRARSDIVTSKDGAVDGEDDPPRQRWQVAEQIPVEAEVETEPLWDGEDELAVRDWSGDFPGDVKRGQQRPLLGA